MPTQYTEDAQAVRPFRVSVPEAALADLRWRIASSWWPERETAADDSQGVRLATIQELAYYWATEYDWRNQVDKGGHYAAWEQPQLFSEEVRAGFRLLRNG